MIVGERIVEFSGTKNQKGMIKGLNIGINLEDVTLVGDNLEVTYVYTANYEDNFGVLKIKGILVTKEEGKLTTEIVKGGRRTRKFQMDMLKLFLAQLITVEAQTEHYLQEYLD
jgi:hypothetical protein